MLAIFNLKSPLHGGYEIHQVSTAFFAHDRPGKSGGIVSGGRADIIGFNRKNSCCTEHRREPCNRELMMD